MSSPVKAAASSKLAQPKATGLRKPTASGIPRPATSARGSHWIGVVLDTPNGRNDGTIKEVSYFKCEPKFGLFCKASKLSREPLNVADCPVDSSTKIVLSQTSSAASQVPSDPIVQRLDFDTNNDAARAASVDPEGLAAPCTPARSQSPSVGDYSVLDMTPQHAQFSIEDNPNGLECGDRVVVTGNRLGTLRYLGPAKFAPGVWTGVELDQPQGKNDGAVQGERYFACKPRYGLFAPAAKVVRSLDQSTAKKLKIKHTRTSAMRIQRTGSQESLASMSSYQSGSVMSSVSKSRDQRPRFDASFQGGPGPQTSGLYVTSPASQYLQKERATAMRSSTAKTGTDVLHQSLKEKEQHIEQLIRERDLERLEMARVNQQLEKAERQLAVSQSETGTEAPGAVDHSALLLAQAQIEKLKADLERSEAEKVTAENALDEERRRAEDLSFRIEEETILKAELEQKVQELDTKQMGEQSTDQLQHKLDTQLADKEKQINHLNDRMIGLEALVKDSQSAQETVQLLMEQTKMDCDKKELMLNTKVTELIEQLAKAHASGSELDDIKTLELETVKSTNFEQKLKIDELEEKLTELKLEMTKGEERQREWEKLQADLTNSLKSIETEKSDLETKLKENSENVNQLTTKLSASEKECSELGEQKTLNDQLNTKLGQLEKTIESLSAQVAQAETVKAELGKVNEHLTDANKEKTQFTAQLQLLNKEKAEADSKVSSLEVALAESRAQHDVLLSAGNDSNTQVQTLSQQIHELNTKIETLSKEKADQDVKIVELEQSRAELKTKLEKTVKLSEQENKVAAEQLKKTENEVNELTAKLAEADKQSEAVQKTCDEQNEMIVDLTGKLNTETTHTNELSVKLSVSEEHINDLSEQLQSNATQHKELVLQLNTQIDELSATKTQLLSSNEQLTTSLNAAQAELERMKCNMSQGNEAATALKAEADAQFKQNETAQKELHERLATASSEQNRLERQVNELNELITQHTDNNHTLTKQLESSKSESESVSAELTSLKTQTQTQQNTHKDTIDKLNKEQKKTEKKLNEQISELQKQLSTANEQLSSKQAELTESKTEAESNAEKLKEQMSKQEMSGNEQSKMMNEQIEQMKKELSERQRNIELLNGQLSDLANQSQLSLKQTEEKYEKELNELKINMDKEQTLSLQLKSELALEQETNKKVNEQANSTSEQVMQLNQKLESSVTELQTCKEQNEKTELELKSLREELSTKDTSNTDLVTKITSEMDSLRTKLTDTENEKSERELNCAQLKTDLEKLNSEMTLSRDKQNENDSQLTATIEQLKNEIIQQNAQLEQNQIKHKQTYEAHELALAELQRNCEMREAEKQALQYELAQTKQSLTAAQSDTSVADLNKSLDEVKERENELLESSQAEKRMLQERLVSLQTAVKTKDDEMVKVMKHERASREVLKQQLEKAESECDRYKVAVREMEAQKMNRSDAAPQDPGNASVELQQQVDFLNSVIIDQKRKNDELLANIDILQRQPIDAITGGVRSVVRKQPAPRVYCDICEQFDEHETEDCPIQDGGEEPSNVGGMTQIRHDIGDVDSPALGHSKHHGQRTSNRQYCDNCEMFGHDTADCTEEETY